MADKIQGTGTSQFLQDRIGLCDAGNAGDLNIDPVTSLGVDLRLGAVLLDTLLKLVLGVIHIFLRGSRFSYGFVGNGCAARQVKAKLDVPVGTLVPAADSEICHISQKAGNNKDQRQKNGCS